MQVEACGSGPGWSDRWLEAERVHRLQNELAAARASVQLARKACSCGTTERYLTRALTALDRAAAALEEGFVARIARAAWPLEPVDLWGVVTETVEDFADVFAHLGITVTLEGEPPEPVWVEGVPRLLRAALANVLKNAAEAMPSGGSVTVALHVVPPPAAQPEACRAGRWARVLVEDTGPGVPASVLPILFKAPISTKGRDGGGLGLLVTNEIVTRIHAGRMTAANREGGGAQFRIELPCRMAEPPVAPRPEGG